MAHPLTSEPARRGFGYDPRAALGMICSPAATTAAASARDATNCRDREARIWGIAVTAVRREDASFRVNNSAAVAFQQLAAVPSCQFGPWFHTVPKTAKDFTKSLGITQPILCSLLQRW